MNSLTNDLIAIAPLLFLTFVSLIVLIFEAVMKQSSRITYWISIVGLIWTINLAFTSIMLRGTAFNSMIIIGGYSSYFTIIFCLAAIFTIVFSKNYFLNQVDNIGEYYTLVLFATIGMMMLASAADMILLFLGLELMSISLYVLAGFLRKNSLSNEASLKYFLLGAFATGFLLYGIALIYGATGSTNIQFILLKLPELISSRLFLIGSGLVLIGLAFKVGAVPFHMWVPDVYQGSPTPISGFMSTGAKAAAFAAFILIFIQIPNVEIKLVLAIVSAASMIAGNIIAISQSNIKRMLAYSSIAHAGYMLIGLASGNQIGRDGILFYLLSYMLMNIGAFGVVSLLEKNEEKNLNLDDYQGLSKTNPALAAILSVFMFSLAGIPPFAGFFGKYYIFIAAVNADLTWLAILGVLTSVVSVYFYLRLVVLMYFKDGVVVTPNIPAFNYVVLTIIMLAITGIGIYPSSVLSIINLIP
ncbi:MAG: NADH-quinone oxidoreductase subunit N [Ignavibacteriales bacterium]|nr:NADH-quinone oxidoreductase subunit N [Ignavibacteriales bacterium]